MFLNIFLCLNLLKPPRVTSWFLVMPFKPCRIFVFQAAEQQSTEEDVSVPFRSHSSLRPVPACLSQFVFAYTSATVCMQIPACCCLCCLSTVFSSECDKPHYPLDRSFMPDVVDRLTLMKSKQQCCLWVLVYVYKVVWSVNLTPSMLCFSSSRTLPRTDMVFQLWSSPNRNWVCIKATHSQLRH